MGKHFRHYVDRKQVSMIFNILSMIHKTGMVEKKVPLNFIHKDGSSRTAKGSIALIRAENGSPMGFRGILPDITDSKQKETTIINAKKEAERELQIARAIQSSFLVTDYPQPERREIATRFRPTPAGQRRFL